MNFQEEFDTCEAGNRTAQLLFAFHLVSHLGALNVMKKAVRTVPRKQILG